MSRRAARARMLLAQTRLRALDIELDRDIQKFRTKLHPSKLLAGSFAIGFSTILLPRRLRMGLLYTTTSVAWPLFRLFAPTMLQNFLQQMEAQD